MIKFSRYPHVNDLIHHYAETMAREDINRIVESGITSKEDAETFSRFIWEMVGQMNEDEEKGIEVLGSTDNSEMIPDISYEIGRLMRNEGHYNLWERISNEEM